ncbi:MAG: SDR family oxidoreductase [Nitrospirae bacterium]|nr:SDR family oxidoreductase [Nitrospirota bacterium]
MALTTPEQRTGQSVRGRFDLTDRVAVITGGAGLLGAHHADAIAEMGGRPVLVDIDGDQAKAIADRVAKRYGVQAVGFSADISRAESVAVMVQRVIERFGHIDILINNAARNPSQQSLDGRTGITSRLEHFSIADWHSDIAVGLTGAFLCSRHIGIEMARRGRGVILNIASDLGLIAPDQRIYRRPGLRDDQQPVKPVSYSVVKHGLIGLTRYLATYWAGQGVRANALSPGGVQTGQDEEFVTRLTNLIPLGRMAREDEYRAAVVFLVSDASSYMTGANIVIDGGRTVW